MMLIILNGNKLAELVTSEKNVVFSRLYPQTQKALLLNFFFFFASFKCLVKIMHSPLRKCTHMHRDMLAGPPGVRVAPVVDPLLSPLPCIICYVAIAQSVFHSVHTLF